MREAEAPGAEQAELRQHWQIKGQGGESRVEKELRRVLPLDLTRGKRCTPVGREFARKRTIELQNGRLGMLAIAGFNAQELTDGKPIWPIHGLDSSASAAELDSHIHKGLDLVKPAGGARRGRVGGLCPAAVSADVAAVAAVRAEGRRPGKGNLRK